MLLPLPMLLLMLMLGILPMVVDMAMVWDTMDMAMVLAMEAMEAMDIDMEDTVDTMARGLLTQKRSQLPMLLPLPMLLLMLMLGILPMVVDMAMVWDTMDMVMVLAMEAMEAMDIDMEDMVDTMARGLLTQKLSQLRMLLPLPLPMLLLMLMLGILPMVEDTMDMVIDMVVMDMLLIGHMDMDITESRSPNLVPTSRSSKNDSLMTSTSFIRTIIFCRVINLIIRVMGFSCMFVLVC